ncbi:MAG: 2-C-methyl-D-erythritol 4-phosphate cytidylyltransferase [Candidatus Fimenecus sp.]
MRIFYSKQSEAESSASRPFVTAIVVAAGNSTRMGGVNKQFIRLDGVPVLVRTLQAFSVCPLIDEIVVSARETDIVNMFSLVKEYQIEKVTDIVRGGDTRQESVFAAIRRSSPFSEYFAIHDGARPLVSQKVIFDTVEKAFSVGAAATGVRVKDTIKVVSETGEIIDTPDRSALWAVHTPQVFERRRYLHAADSVENSTVFTDDCKLMEAAGFPVYMVEGSYENIKITTPEDILLAEGILRGLEE